MSPSQQQLEAIQRRLALGREAWAETCRRYQPAFARRYREFAVVAHADLRELAPFVNWEQLQERWEFALEPTNNATVTVIAKVPDLLPIEVRYRYGNDPREHGNTKWFRDAWPTIGQGFQTYRIQRYDGRYLYANGLEEALGAAEVAYAEQLVAWQNFEQEMQSALKRGGVSVFSVPNGTSPLLKPHLFKEGL